MTDDRLSPSQAAAYIEREWYLKVHPDTVRRWVDQGWAAGDARRARPRAHRPGGPACDLRLLTCQSGSVMTQRQ